MCLTEWLPRQRWYTGKAARPRLRLLTTHPRPATDGARRIEVLVVADDASTPVVVYQVPVVTRASAPATTSAVIGRTDAGFLIDGAQDRAYTGVLWEEVRVGGTPAPDAHLLRGEQSNSSVVFRSPGETPVICKIFRQLQPGTNPDIEIQSALSAAGSPHVPPVIGSTTASWSDPATGAPVTGSAAFAQEFIADGEDGWIIALRSCAEGASFVTDAAALGRATADIHRDLADRFGAAPADAATRSAARSVWQRRADIAATEVPSLARHRGSFATVFDAAADVEWPAQQRIHGDLHLGQVLRSADLGWLFLDFEGEPMRPIAERRAADSPWRDLAGMLRSFDYAAGAQALRSPGDPHMTVFAAEPHAWSRAARAAYIAGYSELHGDTATGPLLAAFELDKAIYEAIYEARNRPEWLSIPLASIDRLLGESTHSGFSRAE